MRDSLTNANAMDKKRDVSSSPTILVNCSSRKNMVSKMKSSVLNLINCALDVMVELSTEFIFIQYLFARA